MTHQISYSNLGTTAYEALRYQLLLNVEETNTPSLQPYADGRGFVTIGVGFNLHDPAIRRAALNSWGMCIDVKNVLISRPAWRSRWRSRRDSAG